MAFKSPHLNEDGYNTQTGAVHCASSEAELFDRYHVFVDLHFCVWEHYAVSGLDGKTLRRVNRQTSIMYDLEHSPFLDAKGAPLPANTRNCIVCGKEVDRAGGRSEVDVWLVKVGTSPDVRVPIGHYRMHDDHRPSAFDVIEAEAARISSPPATVAEPAPT